MPELAHTGSAFKRSFFTVLYSSSLLCLAPDILLPLLVRTGFERSAQDMPQGIDLSQVENGLHLSTCGVRCSDLVQVRKGIWSDAQFIKGIRFSLAVSPIRSPKKICRVRLECVTSLLHQAPNRLCSSWARLKLKYLGN